MDTKRLLVVAFSLFLVMAGFGIIIPALPYYTEHLQGNATAIGFTVGALMGSYSLVQFLFSPVWGHVSDRVGRKPVYLAGLAGFTLSFLLMGSAPRIGAALHVNSLAVLFVARLLGGMLTAAAIPSAFAMVSDLTTPENRGKGMAIVGAMMGMGFVFGPAIGGVLAEHGNLELPFFLASAAAATTFVIAGVIVKETKPEQASGSHHGFFSGLALEGRGLWPWFSLSFLQMVVFSGMETTLALYYHDAFFPGGSYDSVVQQVGLLMGLIGLVGALFTGGMVGRMIKRMGEVVVARLGFALFAIGFLGLALSSSVGMLTASLVVVGLGSGCMRPSLSSGVSRGARTGQGVALGLQSSFDSLARVAGPLLGGALYVVGPKIPYLVNSAVSTAGLAIALTLLAVALPSVTATVKAAGEVPDPATLAN